MTDFEPKILAFACNWCSYAGADLAGISRIQYPPNMRIIRVMCSGRVDPTFILDALSKGADGVMVLGCHPGDCHYISGNLMAERKMRWTAELIKRAGADPRRLRLEWISASEGERFANIASEFTNDIKKLGPLAKEEKEEIKERLEAAGEAVSGSRLRILLGKERELVEDGNVYGEPMSQDDFDFTLEKIINDENTRQRILQIARSKPISIKEIAKNLKLPSNEVGRHVMWLRHKGQMAFTGVAERSPLYKTVEVEG